MALLELRPNCEFCNKDLPPHSSEAMICTYECTFCRDCVDKVLENVCPNCGGNFERRPVRPKKKWREDTGLENHPASKKPVHTKFSAKEMTAFAQTIKMIDPAKR